MLETLCSLLAASVLMHSGGIAPVDDALLTVHVRDPAGVAIESPEAYLIEDENGTPLSRHWVVGDGGAITIRGRDLDGTKAVTGRIRLAVRAPGHAWKMVWIDSLIETPEITVGPEHQAARLIEVCCAPCRDEHSHRCS